MKESAEISQSNSENPSEISQNSTENPAKANLTALEPAPNSCQGYLTDPLTKLHLCQTCDYHQHRNQTKPWVKKIVKQS